MDIYNCCDERYETIKNKEQLETEIEKSTFFIEIEKRNYERLKIQLLEKQQKITDLEYELFKLKQIPVYTRMLIREPRHLFDIAGNKIH